MTEVLKLKYPQHNLSYLKIIKGSDDIITLYQNKIEIFSWSENESIDPDKGEWEKKFWYNKYNCPKESISLIEIRFDNEEQMFKVQIHSLRNVIGLVYFKTKEEANKLYNILDQWRYS